MKGLDTMQKEGQMRITTLNEFMEWAQQLPAGECLFRGVPDEQYGIQASAYRRPKKEDRGAEKFLQINRSLIRDVRLRGYDERNGRKLHDLEILAELQHFGAATCLMDFTYSAQVALWFACQPDSKTPQDSLSFPNGKVFAVYNKLSYFREITPELLEKEINYFFQGSKVGIAQELYQWEPRQQNNRIIAQQSIFLFGDSQINVGDKCVILESSKQDILTALQQVSGITEAMLFPDFDGFARLRGEDIPYTQLSASEYRKRGDQAFRRGEYSEAIADYDEAIRLNPTDAVLYRERGGARVEMRDLEGAFGDFSETIRLNPDDAFAYFDRAGVNANLLARREVAYKSDEYQEVINDYKQVICRYASAPKCAVGAYWRLGDLMHKSGRYEKAMDYFQKGLKIAQEGDFAYFHESLVELHRDMDRHDSEAFEDESTLFR